jgi:hypothetical protein
MSIDLAKKSCHRITKLQLPGSNPQVIVDGEDQTRCVIITQTSNSRQLYRAHLKLFLFVEISEKMKAFNFEDLKYESLKLVGELSFGCFCFDW